MNVEMVEMLIERLGAVEDAVHQGFDRMEQAIQGIDMVPRLQALTPGRMSEAKLATAITTTAQLLKGSFYITVDPVSRSSVQTLKGNGFRMFQKTNPATNTISTAVHWGDTDPRFHTTLGWTEL